MESFDYIVVGAGSAGCVMANRLSADPGVRVLLLEAGPRDRHPLIHIPLGLGKLHEWGLYDWGYKTEPEPGLNGRSLKSPRGKVLGGSSSINVMAFTRGHPADYDRWAAEGAPGWSYADCLPYFRKSERWAGGESERRGGDGHIGIEYARTRDPLFEGWAEAGRALGYPVIEDYNANEPVGLGRSQYTIAGGRRASSASAYLAPVRNRSNLKVVTGAEAEAIVFAGRRATGLRYRLGDQQIEAGATREVIVSAGSFNSPKLLMLSGIGPAAHLQSMGIAPLADLPVGENLQDHMAVLNMYERKDVSTFRDIMRFDRIALAMVQAQLFGTGAATVVPGGLHAFIKTDPGLAVPDIEFMFRGAPLKAHMWFPGVKRPYVDGFGIRPCLLHPKSRGRVSLRSPDPRDAPKILFNAFDHPDDMPGLVRGFRIGRELARQAGMAPYRGREVTPGEAIESDAEIESYIRDTAITANHPAGSCKMGTGADAVLDLEMCVRELEGVRVVDASAMPDMVSGHINACVVMMAERAADAIVRGANAEPARRSA